MAKLVIRTLPDALYRKLKARAQRAGRSVGDEAVKILTDTLTEAEPHSILELRGLGKERWRGLDGAGHVQRERRSWE